MPEIYLCLPSTNTGSLSSGDSADKLGAIMKEFRKAGLPYRLLVLEDEGADRCGVIKARNVLIRQAIKDPECRFIGNFSNDMFDFPQDWLKTMVNYLVEHPTVAAVDAQKIVDYGGGAGWGNYFLPDQPFFPTEGKTWQEMMTAFVGTGVSQDLLSKQAWLPVDDPRWRDYFIAFTIGGGSIVRADWMRKYGMWDEGYEWGGHEEYDLGFRMFYTGYSVVNLAGVKIKHDLSKKGNHFEYPELWTGTHHLAKWGVVGAGANPQNPLIMKMLTEGKIKPLIEGSVW